uniref:LRAT domain-containing protein n=1 Tax=Oryzias sinensis TaxID=183150 RepID=A0A8C7XV31_9TELE
MSCYGNLTYPETYLHFWNRKLRLSTSLASNLPWELAEPAFWNTPLLYCSKTKPGDLIEILRGNFNSWAVYVGNGYVVHFGAPTSRIEGVDGIVKKEKLQYVAGEYSWKVNNTLDGKYRPIPPNEIVKKACSLVGASLKYHLTEFNSEHFATEMRYGKAESRQVVQAYTVGKISIEHVNSSLKKHISNRAIDMKFSPDVGINQSNAHIERNPNIYVHK